MNLNEDMPGNVETTNHDETEHVETPTSPVVVGRLITKTIGLKKHRKQCKVKCKLCGSVCDSVKDLNAHHRSAHDIQFCAECGKGFATKTVLEKHAYAHKTKSLFVKPVGKISRLTVD